MNKNILIIITILVLLLGGVSFLYWGKNNQSSQTHNTNKHMEDMMKPGESMEDHMNNMGHGHNSGESHDFAKKAGSQVDLKNLTSLKAGAQELSFKLYNTKAEELTPKNLQTLHEKSLHLIITKNDLSNFLHLHPEYSNNIWTVSANIPTTGEYVMYYDFAENNQDPTTLFQTVTVEQSTQNLSFPEPNSTATTNNLVAELIGSDSFTSGNTSKLTFKLTQNGKAVSNVEPYLGAFGHVVGLMHRMPEHYLHIHPITETTPQNGQVEFETVFPEAGRYTLFAQFQINGKVETFPITLDVKQGTNNAESTDHSHN